MQDRTSRFLIALVFLAVASRTSAQTLDQLDIGVPNDRAGAIFAVAHQPDGRILLASTIPLFGTGCGPVPCPTARLHLARFHADGSLDTAFDPQPNTPVYAVAVQPDGKILIAGHFTTLGSAATPQPRMARLNPDGTLDTTFAGGANAPVGTLLLQPDGKIVVGGDFTMLGVGAGSRPRNHIGRFNPDGTVDEQFDPGANNWVGRLALQPDGKILVSGGFTTIGGGGTGSTPRAALARLDSSGVPDSFAPAMTLEPVTAPGLLLVQADGRIVIGGPFHAINGVARQGLARLTEAGSLDPSINLTDWFAADVPEYASALTGALQADGRLVFGGFFNQVNSVRRAALARINADGSFDDLFDTDDFGPGFFVQTQAVNLDWRGRVVVAGGFFVEDGAARNWMARFLNTDAATDALTISGGVVTWMRGGTTPEVDRVTFESTNDGATWTCLGPGTRIPGGWELPGAAPPAGAVIRARGFTFGGGRAGSIYEAVSLPVNVNLIQNPDFSNGLTRWTPFATPDLSYVVANVSGGVLEFFRVPPPAGTANQAVVFNETGIPVPEGAALVARFDVGNSSSARKRIGVLVHDSNFGDSAVCTFWLEPNTPLRTYGLATHTTKPIANLTISFYAATTGSDGGFYLVDNVSLRYDPDGSVDRTICTDPTVAAPPGGPSGPELLVNGDFSSGAPEPGWATFGAIQGQIDQGAFEFIKPPGAPAGVLLQYTSQAVPANGRLTATFQFGNSSPVRKRVTVVVHDSAFQDLAACTFWLEPGTPLATYAIRVVTARAWSNATLSIYPATVGLDRWIRVDNVTFRQTPAASAAGTECFEPPAGPGAARRLSRGR